MACSALLNHPPVVADLDDDSTDFDFEIAADARVEFDRLRCLGFDRAAAASVAVAAPLTDAQAATLRAAFAGSAL